MDRRSFLDISAGALASILFGRHSWGETRMPTPPNIVLILADDLGASDLGCYGSKFHETPNLDRLAAQGVRFTRAYSACPVCSPSRASILTGRYPQRFGVTDFLGGSLSPPDSPVLTAPRADALPLEAVTIAEMLKPRGYRSAHVGKWHLGGKGFMPEDQGFDVNIGGSYAGGLSGYLWPKWKGVTQGEAHKDSDYLTDYWTHAGCKFIEETKQPFFLYLAHNAPHIPLEAPADLIKKYEAKRDAHPGAYGRQNNPIYAAMLEKLDDGVGRVLQSLERAGVAGNTSVVFTSDNGGLSVKEQANTPATSNAPLREGKGYLYEGGIRVPMIARLPGVTPAGAACDAPVIGNDFLHTFRAIAQCGPDTMPGAGDGVDLSPVLRDPQAPLAREALYWHYPHFANQGGRPGGAIRRGPWKLIEFYEDGALQLFNLDNDPGETRDVSREHADIVQSLRAMLQQWRTEVGAKYPQPAQK